MECSWYYSGTIADLCRSCRTCSCSSWQSSRQSLVELYPFWCLRTNRYKAQWNAVHALRLSIMLCYKHCSSCRIGLLLCSFRPECSLLGNVLSKSIAYSNAAGIVWLLSSLFSVEHSQTNFARLNWHAYNFKTSWVRFMVVSLTKLHNEVQQYYLHLCTGILLLPSAAICTITLGLPCSWVGPRLI